MSKLYRQKMMDQVKLRIIQYCSMNPDWSPEALIVVSKMFLRHYGLGNRYLPPDFKREEEEVKDDNADGIKTADVGSTQS